MKTIPTNARRLVLLATISACIVGGLMLMSRHLYTPRQPFTRNIIQHFVTQQRFIFLSSSTYLAGITTENIYFGHPNKIFLLTSISLIERNKSSYVRITGPFSKMLEPSIQTDSLHFYIKDGRTGTLFAGLLDDPKGQRLSFVNIPFKEAIPIGPQSIALRAFNIADGNAIVKTSALEKDLIYNQQLLSRQVDGLYSTAGMLHYSKAIHKLVYLYYYRNEYVIADTTLINFTTGSTIDTTSWADVKPIQLSAGTYTLASPKAIVNVCSTVDGGNLFVISSAMGIEESLQNFNSSSVVDVYNLVGKSYQYSFYLPDFHHEKVKSFRIAGDHLVCMYNNYCGIFEIDRKYLSRKENKPKDILPAG